MSKIGVLNVQRCKTTFLFIFKIIFYVYIIKMVRRVSGRNYRSKRVRRKYLRSKRVKSGGSRSLRKRGRSKSLRKLRRRMRGGSTPLEYNELFKLFQNCKGLK